MPRDPSTALRSTQDDELVERFNHSALQLLRVEPALPPPSIARSPKSKRVALEFVSDCSVSILVDFNESI